MKLSKDQMTVVNFGFGDGKKHWEHVDLPVDDDFQVPDWCLGLRIDWKDKYANRPKTELRVTDKSFDWPESWTYDEEHGLYLNKSEDGRLQWYGHGPLEYQTITEWSSALEKHVEVERWCTAKSEGFGGRHFHIKMADGRDAILRGPWHTVAPDGYVEVYTFDGKYGGYGRDNWGGGCFGLAITDDLWLHLMAKFQPELEAARVTDCGMTSLEPRYQNKPPKGFKA